MQYGASKIMKKLNQAEICYLPNNLSLKFPGARRRFVAFAKFKKISFKTKLENNKFELIYIPYGCNIYKILKYLKKNPRTKLIFEMPDSYLSDGWWVSFQKGVGRFLMRKESKIYLDYRQPLKQLLKKSHAVVCASRSQFKILKKYNKKIFITLDFFEDEIKFKKKKWSLNKKKTIRLFWEGMIYNLEHLIMFNEIFKYLIFDVHIVIVTDKKKSLFFNLFNYNVKKIVKKFKFSFEVHEWGKVEISKIATSCDIGVIPIKLNNRTASNKSVNKLVFMWKMGLPVVVSATPAYRDIMKLARLKMYAKNIYDWINILNNFYKLNDDKHISNKKKRVDALIKKNFSKRKLIKDWSEVFQSVGFKT